MKIINKLTILFVLLFVCAFSVYAADYSTPEGEGALIADVVVSTIAPQPYTGKAITPAVTLTYNGVTLTEGTDYTLAYTNNIKIGTAKITIEGKGNYVGTKTVSFKILRNIASAKVSGVVTKTYTGSRQGQKLIVKYGTTTLKAGTHYTASYTNNTNAGTATITIKGKGIYAGTKKVTFKINRRSITGLSFSRVNNYYYTGKAISPNVTVKYGTKSLVKNTDYKIAYTRNINAGTATITITGLGNYYGTKTITFKINKRPITYATITGLAGKTYTGSRIGQNLKLVYNGITLKAGTHYTLSYTNNLNAGTATVTITGKGNFSGSKKLSFKIYKRNVSTLTITSGTATTYAGSARTPAVTVKQGTKVLTKNTHYTVAYKNNLNVGTATITVTGKGNYTGTKTLTFEIKPRAISTVTITGLANKVYTGNRIGQSLKLTYGKFTLKAGIDYTLTYANNTEVGKATVTVTGKGNYTGTKELTFNINKRNVSSLTYNKVSNYVYSGKAITPAITVKYGTKVLVKDTDYTVAYTNNTNVGTATITITGMESYTGTKKITFSINRRNISTATITGLAAKEYTGSNVTQALTLTYNDITLKAGTHYTIAYTNNKNVGKATVTITGKGNFTGTKTLTFNINPQVPTIKSAVATGKNIKVTWNKVANATGYVLYMSKDGAAYSKLATITKNSTVTYTAQNLEVGEYSFKVRAYKNVSKVNYYSVYSEAKAAIITSVPVPTIKFGEKVTGPDMSVQYTILMENTSELDGVEVYYATSATGEYKLQRSYPKADFEAYDIAVEIPKDAHYYFKVRGYKEVNGTKVYGAYSNVLDFNNEVKNGPVTYILGEDIEVGLYKLTPIDASKNIILTEYIPPEVYEELPPGAGFAVESVEMHNGYVEITKDYEGIIVENATLEKITLEDIPTNIKTSVSNGMYVVGKDITAGMYKVTSSKVAEIRLMDSAILWDWSNLEQLQNGYIKIPEETKFVNVLNGTITKVDMDEIPTDIKTTVSNGMYLVGKDVAPGTYKVTMTEKVSDYYFNVGIYWQGQYSLEMGAAMMERGYIEIPQNAYAVNLIGATIEKITEIPTNIKTTVSEDGTYIVGKDLAPGVYKATSTETMDEPREIYRMSGISLNYEEQIAYGYSAYDYVEIKDTDKAIYIQNYKLEKVDFDNIPVNLKTTVSNGVYVVGKDIAPGTYKVQTNNEFGSVEKANALDMSYESYTGSLMGNGYIEVAETDIIVRVEDATITKINLEDIPVNIKTTIAGDGMYLVGKDLDYGIYKVTPYGDSSYYGSVGVLSTLDGHYTSQINYWYGKYGFVEVDSECVAVEIEGLQLEKIVPEDMPVNIKTTVSDGAYLVGKDIAPGIYKVQGTGKSYCDIQVYANASDIISGANLKTGYIEIPENAFGVTVIKGTITKIEEENIPTNIKTTVSDGAHIVGKNIEAGIYKVESTVKGDSYIQLYDDLNMMGEHWLTSYEYKNGYIEITEEVVVVQVNGATLTKVELENIPTNIKDTVTSDYTTMYLVGKDLTPGVYKYTGETQSSWVNTYITIDRTYSNNYCNGKNGYITVEETDVAVVLVNGTLTKIDMDNLPEANIQDSVEQGSYIVGVDIAPGMYMIESAYDNNCMAVYVYSDITTDYEYQTSSEYTARGFIEIKDTDVFVQVQNSGTMTKVDIDKLPVDIKTEISHENYSAGTYIVGKDIEPGIYEISGTYNPDWHESYVHRYSSVTTDWENQLGEGYVYNANGIGYIEVLPTDTAIYIYNATIRKTTFDDIPVNMKDTVSDGTYIVGKDLAYGTYKYTLNEGAESSWIETYSSLNTHFENKINEYSGNYGYFELSEAEKTIRISDATITKVDLNEMPEDIKTSVTTGTYIVGKDIAPGTYKATGIDGSWAYVARLSSINPEDIIEEYSAEEVYIEIKDTDVAVYVGGWTLLEKVDSIPETPSEEEMVVEQNNAIEQEVESIEETTTIEEPQQTEVSIYKEVDIYTED